MTDTEPKQLHPEEETIDDCIDNYEPRSPSLVYHHHHPPPDRAHWLQDNIAIEDDDQTSVSHGDHTSSHHSYNHHSQYIVPRAPPTPKEDYDDREEREHKRKFLISLGMLLPAVAAIIGTFPMAAFSSYRLLFYSKLSYTFLTFTFRMMSSCRSLRDHASPSKWNKNA